MVELEYRNLNGLMKDHIWIDVYYSELFLLYKKHTIDSKIQK